MLQPNHSPQPTTAMQHCDELFRDHIREWLSTFGGLSESSLEFAIDDIARMASSDYSSLNTSRRQGVRKMTSQNNDSLQTPAALARHPKKGDIIQTGMILGNGGGSIVWGSHQVVRRVSSDGTIWYRPREAKVDKSPSHWRFPVESREEVIRDLKHWANPAEGKEAIKRLLAGEYISLLTARET